MALQYAAVATVERSWIIASAQLPSGSEEWRRLRDYPPRIEAEGVHMDEFGFHKVVLVGMGISGLFWFIAALRAKDSWSAARRAFVGAVSFLVYLVQSLQAFPAAGQASAAELFGFLGCCLGCAGAGWQLVMASERSSRSA
jgi:pimeloyl-ACP methyl ester carboxylesterase